MTALGAEVSFAPSHPLKDVLQRAAQIGPRVFLFRPVAANEFVRIDDGCALSGLGAGSFNQLQMIVLQEAVGLKSAADSGCAVAADSQLTNHITGANGKTRHLFC